MFVLLSTFAFSLTRLKVIKGTASNHKGDLNNIFSESGDPKKNIEFNFCYGGNWPQTIDWTGRWDLNVLKDICGRGFCTSSYKDFYLSENFTRMTDNDIKTAASVKPNSLTTEAWFEVRLPKPTFIKAFGIRSHHSKPIQFTFMDNNRNIIHNFTSEDPDIYWGREFVVDVSNVKFIRVNTSTNPFDRGYCYANQGPDCSSFSIIEMGARTRDCDYWANFELESFSKIKNITMYTGNDVKGYNILISTDGKKFNSLGYWQSTYIYKPQEIVLKDFTPLTKHILIHFPYNMSQGNAFKRVSMSSFQVFGETTRSECAKSCSNHGKCVNGACQCEKGYNGTDCSDTTVNCSDGWEGNNCQTPVCLFNCWNRGKCVAPFKCQCTEPYTGADCRLTKFADTVYSDVDLIMPEYTKSVLDSNPTFIDASCSKDKPRKCEDSGSASLQCESSIGKCVKKPNFVFDNFDGTPSYTPISVQTSSEKCGDKVIDGNEGTACYSTFTTLPNSFFVREDLNPFYDLCKKDPTKCKSSTENTNLNFSRITDTDDRAPLNFAIDKTKKKAWFEIEFPEVIRDLRLIAIRKQVVASTLRVIGIKTDNSEVELCSDFSGTFYTWFTSNTSDWNLELQKIRVESDEPFSITALAGLKGTPTEWVMIDLGSSKEIGLVRGKHWSGGSKALFTLYELSTDKVNWVKIANRSSSSLAMNDVVVYPSQQARYVRVSHYVPMSSSEKYSFWELQSYGKEGNSLGYKHNNSNDVKAKHSLFEMTGINSVWGFPARRFKDVVSHVRNYHNVNWDIGQRFDQAPTYANMSAQQGTRATWWLNWDQAYGDMQKSGLKVQVSLQFLKKSMTLEQWTPKNIYNYGYLFGKHFGPLHGTGQVDTVEIGNEPDVSTEKYREILLNMAKGIKEADPTIKVITGTLWWDILKYHIKDTINYIDGINVHSYSYSGDDNGRIGVHPESKGSTFRNINNYVHAIRNNLPTLPLYVTEFGWDAAGEGNKCRHSTCVSINEQSIYLLRSLFILNRLNIERGDIYFYCDSSSRLPEIYSRSGLLEDELVWYERKQSWYALRNMMKMIGAAKFDSVIKEDEEAFIYKFTLLTGSVTKNVVVAWRPIKGEDKSDQFEASWTSFGENKKAFELGGYEVEEKTVTKSGNIDKILVSGFPIVVIYDPIECSPDCKGKCMNGKCFCNKNQEGENCEKKAAVNMCFDHGENNVDGSCTCDKYYDPKENCRYRTCNELCLENGGKCIKGKCVCPIGLTGAFCNETACPNDCRKRGQCVNGTCICDNPDQMLQPGCEWRVEQEHRAPDIDLENCPEDKPFKCSSKTLKCVSSRGQCNPNINKEITHDKVLVTYLKPVSVHVSSAESQKENVINENENNAWWSTTCYKANYITRKDVNYLYNLPEKSIDSTTVLKGKIVQLVDGQMTNTVQFDAINNEAYIQLNKNLFDVHFVVIFIGTHSKPVKIELIDSVDKAVKLEIKTFEASQTGVQYIDIPNAQRGKAFSAVRISSAAKMDIGEVAVQCGPCSEWAMIDLGEKKTIGAITTRIWTKNSKFNCSVQYSNDNQTWTTIKVLQSSLLYKHDIPIIPEIEARYVRVFHIFNDEEGKGNCWILNCYGRNGKFGVFPQAIESTRTFAEALGINGIWQWGSDGKEELKKLSYPNIFNSFSRHGRNYHNLNWDSGSPMNIPDYDTMEEGTLNQNWLDWDSEYAVWNNYSIEVQVSFQFDANTFPFISWGDSTEDAVKNARDYGRSFSSHFGPTNGTGNVFTFEIGNEPWQYNWPEEYQYIIKGFSLGIKEGDPRMQVLNAAPPSLNDFTDTLNKDKTILSTLDGINVHGYSVGWNGTERRGVMPEDKSGSFANLGDFVRWRDVNAPNMPLFLSEWGWGASDNICKHQSCVSEAQQACYLVRGLMLLSRMNFYRTSIFFYADGNECGTSSENIYSCHGILGSELKKFKKKAAFDTLKDFVELIGDYRFSDVLLETDEVIVYKISDLKKNENAFVIWRPIEDLESTERINGLNINSQEIAKVVTFGKKQREIDNNWSQNDKLLSLEIGGYPKLLVPAGSKILARLANWEDGQKSAQTKMSGGKIAGIVIGTLLGVALVAVGGFFLAKKVIIPKMNENKINDFESDPITNATRV